MRSSAVVVWGLEVGEVVSSQKRNWDRTEGHSGVREVVTTSEER